MELLYNFDCTRSKEDCLLINWYIFTPVFGGIIPPGHRSFRQAGRNICICEKSHPSHKCEVGMCNFCFCTSMEPDDLDVLWDSCGDRHSHHYCLVHVIAWLHLYQQPTILLQESEQLSYERIQRTHTNNPDVLQYYRTKICRYPNILLQSARCLGYPHDHTRSQTKHYEKWR